MKKTTLSILFANGAPVRVSDSASVFHGQTGRVEWSRQFGKPSQNQRQYFVRLSSGKTEDFVESELTEIL